MNKKNIATTIVLILCSALFTVTGSAFMTYVYAKNKIVVENPKVFADSNVLVYMANDDSKKQAERLTFSDISLGLKPVTGDISADSNIPSTVTDKQGSEGLYSSFKVSAPAGLSIQIKNVVIDCNCEEDLNKEKENLYVALKDVDDSDNSLESDVVTLLVSKTELHEQEFTLYFWIGSAADDNLKGVKISFEVYFIL